MAITMLGSNIMSMTEVNDVYPDQIKVAGFICLTTDTSGVFEVVNGAGDMVFRSGTMNTQERVTEDGVGWMDGLEVSSIPANGTLIVHFE
jgi:hypothetical protein